jgi:hypothetical protein
MGKPFFILFSVILGLLAYEQGVITRKPEVILEVMVDNRAVTEGELVQLKVGQSVRLNVQVVQKDGSKTDVTKHSKTQLVSFTPWILAVTNTGLVTASGSEAINASGEHDVGIIGITHGDAREAGTASIFFKIDRKLDTTNNVGMQVQTSKRMLRVGETAQVTVVETLADGSTRDLTTSMKGTTYRTTSESLLIPEPDGRVTCISTQDENRKFATIGIENGNLRNKITFELRPGGPGPRLQVTAEKPELHEGEQVQLHVFKSLPTADRKELTTNSAGTRYLTFSGYGVANQDVIKINETGLASATSSIGKYSFRTVIVFVRNGDAVGWIQLRVIRANGK